MKKLNFLNKILFIINNIVAIMLLLSLFVPYIKPSSLSIAPIFGLIIPALILINILFVFYWIVIGFRKQFLLSTFVLIIGYFFSTPIYKFSSKAEDKFENELTIMSYNVRKFNIYNWIKDDSIPERISRFIKNEQPDVVALQEFRKDKNFILNYPFVYNHYTYNYYQKRTIQSGLVIYSKHPIINKGSVYRSKFVSDIIYVDILKNKDTLRIYNFHLFSLGVTPNEDNFGYNNSDKLLQSLRKSLAMQQKEVGVLKAHMATFNHKAVLVGDLNNTAYSWVYKNLKGNLKDSFIEDGLGFGKTFDFKGFPLRIDYILVDKQFEVKNHKNYSVKYSDHYPIMATVSF